MSRSGTGNPRLMLVTTAPFALWAYFRPQIRFLVENGFDVHAATSPGPLFDECAATLPVPLHPVPMARRIDPVADLASIYHLVGLIREVQPDIVHLHTPKAGLVGSIASALAGTRVRIFTIHGLPLQTRTGWRRRLLAAAERLACTASTHVLCIGPSLREIVVDLGICSRDRMRLLGDGSCSGIDLDRFDPRSPYLKSPRGTLAEFGCPFGGPVVTYVGRFVQDKGLADLAIAWTLIRDEFPAAHLLLCGEFEPQDPLHPAVVQLFQTDRRVHISPTFVEDTPSVYAASTVVVMPSYREGLGHVPLEASAMEKPIVATNITGCVDSVQHDITGLLVEPRHPEALATAIRRLLQDPALCKRLGQQGRQFVTARYSQDRVSHLILAEYRRLLDGHSQHLRRTVSIEPRTYR